MAELCTGVLSQLSLTLTLLAWVTASILALAALRRPVPSRFLTMAGASGFVAHTIFIGTICSRTGRPPLTNMQEIAVFLAWTLVAIEIVINLRTRLRPASTLIYPIALALVGLAALVGFPFDPAEARDHSLLFLTHLLTTALGVALLIVAFLFLALSRVQESALVEKKLAGIFSRLPSVRSSDRLGTGLMVPGFLLFTAGIVAGFFWAFQPSVDHHPGIKEIFAVAAWLIAAIIVWFRFSGGMSRTRYAMMGIAAFVSIVVAILGISHV